MSKRKKKGYSKFAKKPRLVIRPQENGMLFDTLEIYGRIRFDYIRGYTIELRPSDSNDVKQWVKLNGMRIGQTSYGASPLYSIRENFYKGSAW